MVFSKLISSSLLRYTKGMQILKAFKIFIYVKLFEIGGLTVLRRNGQVRPLNVAILLALYSFHTLSLLSLRAGTEKMVILGKVLLQGNQR